jgi:hypothetical protein
VTQRRNYDAEPHNWTDIIRSRRRLVCDRLTQKEWQATVYGIARSADAVPAACSDFLSIRSS